MGLLSRPAGRWTFQSVSDLASSGSLEGGRLLVSDSESESGSYNTQEVKENKNESEKKDLTKA